MIDKLSRFYVFRNLRRRVRINNEIRRIRAELDLGETFPTVELLLNVYSSDPLFRKKFYAMLSRRTEGQDRWYFEERQAQCPETGAPAESRQRRWACRLADLAPSWLRISKESS